MTRRRAFAVGLCLLVLIGARPALAHQTPYSYLDLHVYPDSLSGKLSVHIDDLGPAASIDPTYALLNPKLLQSRAAQLDRIVGARMIVLAGETSIQPEWGWIEPIPERSLIAFHWRASWVRPPSRLVVRGPMFPEDPQHETFVNFYLGATDLIHQDLLDKKDTEVEYESEEAPQSLLSVIWTFVGSGIHHIFIGPDHILFIVGLLLLGGGIRRLLKIVTAFTIAHSITLALATLQIVNPSPRIIEPAIALSIVYVGIENLIAVRRKRDIRAGIAFFFGFVHGFGFASVLREFGLPSNALAASLFAFNAGVELGQATIVLAVAPLLALIRAKEPRLTRPVIAVGSVLVILAGSFWFVERVFAR